MDVLDEINMIRSQQHMASLIRQANTGPGVIPFVGAGLSACYGIKPWGSFLRETAQIYMIEDKVVPLLDSFKYEEAGQLIEKVAGSGDLRGIIEETFGPERMPNPLPHRTAVEALIRVASGPVLTTNYDYVLEKVFGLKKESAFKNSVWGAKADIALKSVRSDAHILVKLHGDAMDMTDLVLTRKDYDRVYGNLRSFNRWPPLPKLLHLLFLAQRPLLFLGCSLHSDRTMQVLDKVVAMSSFIQLFAIVEAPAGAARDNITTELIERNLELSNRNINAIWYPNGKHELVPKLIDLLAPSTADVPARAVSNFATATIPRPTLPPSTQIQAYDCGTMGYHAFGEAVTEVADDGQEIRVWSWSRKRLGDGWCVLSGPYANDLSEEGIYRVRFRIRGTGFAQPAFNLPILKIDVTRGGDYGVVEHDFVRSNDLARSGYNDYELWIVSNGGGLWEYRATAFDGVSLPNNIAMFEQLSPASIYFDTITVERFA